MHNTNLILFIWIRCFYLFTIFTFYSKCAINNKYSSKCIKNHVEVQKMYLEFIMHMKK